MVFNTCECGPAALFFVRFVEVFSLPLPTLVFGNTHLTLSVISTHIWKVLENPVKFSQRFWHKINL